MSKAYSIGPDGKLVFDAEIAAAEERQRQEELRALTEDEIRQRIDLKLMADDHDHEWRELHNELDRRRKERRV